VKFFKTPAEWRTWLSKNHDRVDELDVGFYKTSTGKPSITWKESVDEALCFGWIDGRRTGIDDETYKIRFTPRRAGSNWSAINIARVKELEELGLMHDAGRAAFAKRQDEKSSVYSYEQRKNPELSPEELKRFRAKKKAWAYFSEQAPSYRRAVTHWVISAKKAETRERRLETLIADSESEQWIKPMRYSGKKKK
jgi:uncharacterized protein YdeI (YjbR/CyaY-like superfamily)